MRRALLAGLVFVGALTGCTVTAAPDATEESAVPTSRATATVDDSWVTSGFTRYDDELAWQWQSLDVKCKAYQDDGCFAIKVLARNSCPSGVYVLLSIQNASGDVVGSANEITGGVRAGQAAVATLDMPGGSPKGAKARVSKMNCLS